MNLVRVLGATCTLALALAACSGTGGDDLSVEEGSGHTPLSEGQAGPTVSLRYEVTTQSEGTQQTWVSEFAGTPWTQWANVAVEVPESAKIEGASSPEVEYNDHGRVNKAYLSERIDVASAEPLQVVEKVADEQQALEKGLVRQSPMGDSPSDWATPLPPGNDPKPANSRVERGHPSDVPDHEIVSPTVIFSKMVAMNLAQSHPDSHTSIDGRWEEWVPADVRPEVSRSAVADRLGIAVGSLTIHSAASRTSCDMSTPQGGQGCTFRAAVVHENSDVPLSAYLNNAQGTEKVLRVTHFSATAP